MIAGGNAAQDPVPPGRSGEGVTGLLDWWRSGEAGSSLVFRQTYWTLVWTAAIAVGVEIFMPWARVWYCVAIFAAGLAGAFAERRRAYIFSADGFAYRPAFGAPVRVAFADVLSVESGAAVVPLGMRAQLVRGMCVKLRDGRESRFPLDFPESSRIMQALQQRLRHGD